MKIYINKAKRGLSLLFMLILMTFLSQCKKQSIHVQGSKVSQVTEDDLFSINTIVNEEVKIIATQLKKQNDQSKFLQSFIDRNGIIMWDYSEQSKSSKTAITIIPFGESGRKEVLGFVLAKHDFLTESTVFSFYNKGNLVKYGFDESNTKAINARKVFELINYFNYKIFDISRIKLQDIRFIPSEHRDLVKDGKSINRLYGNFIVKPISVGINSYGGYYCISITNSTDWWWDPDGDEDPCHCSGNESYAYTTYTVETFCADTGGGGGGGDGSPEVPPTGGGGSSGGGSQLSTFVNTLSYSENNFWTDFGNSLIVSSLSNRLNRENFSSEVQDFVRWAIDYLIDNPLVDHQTFENQFLLESEGVDFPSFSVFWDDPNNTFSHQTLPSMSAFKAAFPKRSDPLYNTPSKLHASIGGSVLSTVGTGDNVNTCAVRVSKALNYSGVTIPYIANQTYQGSDGKYYFLGAENLNRWMRKVFGCANPNTAIGEYLNSNSIHYNADQIAKNGSNLPQALFGVQGIYSMVSNNSNWATGHADLISSATCDGGCHFDGPIRYIDIWKLN